MCAAKSNYEFFKCIQAYIDTVKVKYDKKCINMKVKNVIVFMTDERCMRGTDVDLIIDWQKIYVKIWFKLSRTNGENIFN